MFLIPVTSFITFLQFFQICALVYRPFRSFRFFVNFCVARTLWVKRHLDVVLEVLQVVGSKFLFYKTCRYLPWKKRNIEVSKNFNFGNLKRTYFSQGIQCKKKIEAYKCLGGKRPLFINRLGKPQKKNPPLMAWG